MKRKRNLIYQLILIPVLALGLLSLAFTGNDRSGGKGGGKGGNNSPSLKAGDAYRMFINNLNMPMNRVGVMGDVALPDPETGGTTSGGKFGGHVFLFSGGFFLSGMTNGSIWSNAVASASRIQDYRAGTVASGPNDPRAQLYVLRAAEGDFAASWDEWKDAVALGAYFYDGDGDGVYDPVDKNGNGKWDTDEDRPDLIGDETVWCVYNDGVDPALRRFNDVDPQGIEIRQSVFAFNSKSFVGNMMFLRYSILNTGLVADVIDSVYFGVWADPDLGEYEDDLVASDTTRNAGYVYNDGDDAEYGANPPTFLIDFFQGPIIETGNMNDTAHIVNGQVRGIELKPGFKNLGLSSFVHYMQSHPTHGDPNTRIEARNYMLGLNRVGTPLDPCTWTFGEVRGGVDCSLVDPRFSYSGDPVTNTGWINNTATDQRQMSNTGPFQLKKGEPIDIVVAYVVGRGNNALQSITVAKEYSDIAQLIFDSNFPSPPPPLPIRPMSKTGSSADGSGFIDITWETSDQFRYRATDTVLGVDRRVKGFYVTAYRSNSKDGTIGGIENARVIGAYTLNDQINNIYTLFANGNQEIAIEDPGAPFRLDSLTYANPLEGRVRLRITADPFTGEPLIPGKPYYYTMTTYALNHEQIFLKSAYDANKSIVYGPPGDYIARAGAIDEYESQINTIFFGTDLYSPQQIGGIANQASGAANGKVQYVVVDNNQLTGDNYEVKFEKDLTVRRPYTVKWTLRNTTKGTDLVTGSAKYDTTLSDISGQITDGFIVKINPVVPALGTPTYSRTPTWYKPFSATDGTGVQYMGDDVTSLTKTIQLPKNPTSGNSFAVSADRLRRVELRFGAPNAGKAYRYLMGFPQASALAGPNVTNFRYAAAITTAADTANCGPVGKFGEGFVDVPFTAWIVDARTGEERQLAVGFYEVGERVRLTGAGTRIDGKPDGVWTPGDSLVLRGEGIFIFDSPYDPTGSQVEHTGGVFSTGTQWAEIRGGINVPAGATFNGVEVTERQRTILRSPFMNSLYSVQFQKRTPDAEYAAGDTLKIPVSVYPYFEDRFTFSTTQGGAISTETKKQLFEKVNVVPNPLFAFNPATSYAGTNPDEPFVTFTNLPNDVTVKIFSLSGLQVRTLNTSDKLSPTSPFLRWNLENENGLRVASGMYIAIVSSPEFGEKVLKFGIIMPQKQIQRY